MATIPLTRDYRITSDSNQWMLEKRKVNGKTGETYWASEGMYYSDIEKMIPALAQRLLRESDVEGVAELRQEAERIGRELSDALTPHLSINLKAIRG